MSCTPICTFNVQLVLISSITNFGLWDLLRARRRGRPCGVRGAEVGDDRRQFARVHLHPEPVLHEERERHLLLDAVAWRYCQAVAEEHAAGDVLHLQVGQVLAEADPRAGIERHESVRVVRLEFRAVGGQPPLRAELQAVLPPHRLHAPRRVDGVRHRRPRRDERAVGEVVIGDDVLGVFRDGGVQAQGLRERRLEVDQAVELLEGEGRCQPQCRVVRAAGVGEHGAELAHDLALRVRVGGDEPEEPGERDGGGVPAGEDEVERHVLQRLVRVGPLAHEPGQQVVVRPAVAAARELELARLDDGGEVLVHVRDAARQHGLHAEAEPLLAPPQALGEDEAVKRGLRGAVEGRGEGVLGQAWGQCLGVLAERQAADVVEGEAEQEVLEVDDVRRLPRRVLQDGQQAEVDGPRHPARHGGAQRARGELERRRLALRDPRVAVGVKDAVAEEVAEHGVPEVALGVVVEAGLEDVLQVARVAGDRDQPAAARHAGHREDAGLVRAPRAAQVGGDPLVHVLRVLQQPRQAAQHRPHPRTAQPPRQAPEPRQVRGHYRRHHRPRPRLHCRSSW
jgi:hypothetical protein